MPVRLNRLPAPVRAAGLSLAGLFITVCLSFLGCERRSAPTEEVFRLRNQAKVHYELGTDPGCQQAIRLLEEVLAKNPGDPLDQANLARALIFTRQEEAARRALGLLAEARRSQGGMDAPLHLAYLEGLARLRLGDAAAAAAALRVVAAKDPACLPAWYQMGQALASIKKYDEAFDALAQAAAQDSSFIGAGALYKMGQVLRLAGREQESDAALEKFKKLQPTLPAGKPGPDFYERSRYTAMSLIPPPRPASEPPPARFDFAEAPEWLPAPALADAFAAIDLDNDGDADLVILRDGKIHLWRQEPGPKFADSTALSGLAEEKAPRPSASGGAGIAAGDYNNDGLTDLFFFGAAGPDLLARNLGEGVLEAAAQAGAAGEPGTLEARWADFDHDGDLDLVLLAASRARVLRNNGDGTFLAMAAGGARGLFDVFPAEIDPPAVPAGGRIGFDAADLDLGNDLDFVFPGARGAAIARNRRLGPFDQTALAPLAGAALILAADFDGDGDPDLAAIPSAGSPLALAWNEGPADAPAAPPRAGKDSAAPPLRFRYETFPNTKDLGAALDGDLGDLDNDGDLDLAAAAEKGVLILRNQAGGKFTAEKVPALEKALAARLQLADLDGDGLLDLALIDRTPAGAGGTLRIFRNRSAPAYGAYTVKLIGVRDNRPAVGARVELYAGRHYQVLQVRGPGGARFGAGPAGGAMEKLDGLRVLWPNGVAQAVPPGELVWDQRRSASITQKEGLVVSCPFLYVFDGARYRFLTDLLGVAPLDEWAPEGAGPPLDPEEYVRIPGELLRSAPGEARLRLAITEELRETAYLDRLGLIEVRSPEEFEVFGKESTRQEGFEPLEIFLVKKSDLQRPAVLVPAGGGGRAGELLAAQDGRYLHAYQTAPPQGAGWVEPYALEIHAAPAARALLLTGRIRWPDSDAAFSLSQHGRSWLPLRLEIPGLRGDWPALLPDLGFPAGMDRAVVVDFGPAGLTGDGRLRLVSSYPYLWDRIAVARRGEWARLENDGAKKAVWGDEAVRLERRTLPLRGARLSSRGFSAMMESFARHEQVYDYERPEPGSLAGLSFERARGLATRHGEVKELLLEADDRLAVLVSGDGLEIEFSAPEPLPPGWGRTYFLQVTGWAKEANFHNRTGRWIAPLPYRSMEKYPPDEERPRDQPYQEYLTRYQNRWVDK